MSLVMDVPYYFFLSTVSHGHGIRVIMMHYPWLRDKTALDGNANKTGIGRAIFLEPDSIGNSIGNYIKKTDLEKVACLIEY